MRRSGLRSFLTFLICLSLIVGATYALFSSKSETNIAITSGKVDVVATLERADGEWVYSPTLIDYDTNDVTDDTNAADQATGTFVNGGFASLDGKKLTLTNMTPGDKVMLNIRISNNSTVAVKYSTRLWVSADTGLFSGLDISVGGEPFTFTQETEWKTMEVDCEDIVIPVVVYLPEEAGNDYSNKSVELSFSVSAVQANTDTDALEHNAENTVYLHNATDLFMFANDVNNGNTYAGKTVVLLNDVDLGGKEWTPIGQTGYHQFYGNFDGSNKTVSNFYIDTTNGVYPAGADVASGFFGWLPETSQTISNLKLDNFSVTAYRKVAGVVGYISGSASVVNCHVSNATIKALVEPLADGSYDNGDKVGGIVGFTNHGNTVTGCSVTSSTIIGYRDIGGIAGYNYGTVTGCNVANVNIISDATENYKSYTAASEHDAHELVGEGNAATDSTATDVTVTVTVVVSSDDALGKLLSSLTPGAEPVDIYLAAGEYTVPDITCNADSYNVNFIGATNADGTPATVMSISENVSGYIGWSISGTIKNIKFEDETNSKHIWVTDGNGTYKNIEFNNCVFDGATLRFNAEAKIIDCVFDGNGEARSGLQYCYPQGDILIEGCTFGGYCFTNLQITDENAHKDVTVTVKDCTIGALSDNASSGSEGVTIWVDTIVLENNTIDCDVWTPSSAVSFTTTGNTTSDGGEVSFKNW